MTPTSETWPDPGVLDPDVLCKFMPGGLLAVISLVVLGVMILTIDWSPQPAAGG
jgi:hypothetical protein